MKQPSPFQLNELQLIGTGRLRAAALLASLLMASAFVSPSWGQELAASAESTPPTLNFLDLLMMGRYWMIPILLMSLVVGTCAIERLIGLRQSRVLPRRLASRLKEMGERTGSLDPAEVRRICSSFPSTVSNVVQAMLSKIGRPHREVEQAAREASQREATRLHANVRWLNLAATVTPLMGLLGTVWGMIRAFHDTTQLAPGRNRADDLAEGIYIALVTTLGGLLVAIPAAICAHYFEGRIQKIFLAIDELLFDLMPRVEHFEGQRRYSPDNKHESRTLTPHVEPPPVQAQAGRNA